MLWLLGVPKLKQCPGLKACATMPPPIIAATYASPPYPPFLIVLLQGIPQELRKVLCSQLLRLQMITPICYFSWPRAHPHPILYAQSKACCPVILIDSHLVVVTDNYIMRDATSHTANNQPSTTPAPQSERKATGGSSWVLLLFIYL